MQALKRSPARALSKPQSCTSPYTPRRYESSTPSPASSHPTPKTEGFGMGFYIAVTSMPVGYIVYQLSSGDTSNNVLVRAINAYSDTRAEWAERNALHTRMVEQAGHDRNLFLNTKTERTIDLKFPEVFGQGSPFNVPAGHGSANLEKLVAHYQDKAFREEEEKHQLMKEGKLPVQLEQAGVRAAAESTGLAEAGAKGA